MTNRMTTGEREREARMAVGFWGPDPWVAVLARQRNNFENDLDAYRAAVRSAVLAEAVQTAKVECSRLASEKADKECKGREGLWEMIEGEESARLSRIVLALTALEATDGR